MSETQLISMRMPVDLVAKVDGLAEAQGRSRANVILRALEVGLGKQAVTEMLPSSEVVQVVAREIDREHERTPEPVQSAKPEREVSKVETAKEDGKLAACPRCGGPTVEWGPQQRRCGKCGANYPK